MPIPSKAAHWEALDLAEADVDVVIAADHFGCTNRHRIASASRLLERERCVAALDNWLAYRYGVTPWEGTNDEARRILGVSD